MIDTITIELNAYRSYTDSDFNLKAKWGTNYQQEKNKTCYMYNVALEWSKEAKEKWEYLPEVTYVNFPNPSAKKEDNGRIYGYQITFSAPKLLYGNNIEEVTEDQFEEIVDVLYEQLQFLALPTEISKQDIKQAKLRRLDYGKNAMIAELMPGEQFCSMLMRSEHTYRSKYAQAQYRHGDLYRENIKTRSVVVYDKLAEFRNTLKKKPKELNVREQFFLAAEKAHLFQVFRLEVQIQNLNQIAIELERFGVKRADITFERVFSQELAHNVLMRYWKGVIKNLDPNPELFSEENIFATFNEMTINKGNKTPMNLLATFGLRYLAHKCGLGNVKDIFYREYDSQAWGRVEKLYEEPKLNQGLYTFIDSIEKIIDNMEPLQFGEYNGVFEEEA